MTGEEAGDVLIPAELVVLLREILARALDRSEGATEQGRAAARHELVGAMGHLLGPPVTR